MWQPHICCKKRGEFRKNRKVCYEKIKVLDLNISLGSLGAKNETNTATTPLMVHLYKIFWFLFMNQIRLITEGQRWLTVSRDSFWEHSLLSESNLEGPLSYTVQTLDLILPCIRRIPKMLFWIERKILLRLLLCILGLFLPPNFTLSFDYPGSEETRFESRVRINGEYFSQLLSMNKTHTFNTIHIFWLISHCEKDLWTKVKCPA